MGGLLDVVGIGALNLDRLYTVERIAGGGEEVAVEGMEEAPGGSAANTVVALARLGHRTGFIGLVGRDPEGEFLLEDLEREGVDTSFVRSVEGKTGIILGFVDREGERALYAYPGVNNLLEAGEEALRYASQARILHLSSFVGGASWDAQKRFVASLPRTQITFAPGMLYAHRGLEEISLILRRSAVVFLNREELRIFTGKGYMEGVEAFLALGAKTVVVTLGKEGCLIATPNERWSVPSRPAKVVDTTGAGDAFVAGYLSALLEGKDPVACGERGNWVASRAIGRRGAREGLPRRTDLESPRG
jgi:ribokinase